MWERIVNALQSAYVSGPRTKKRIRRQSARKSTKISTALSREHRGKKDECERRGIGKGRFRVKTTSTKN